jgi:hypothetical protein
MPERHPAALQARPAGHVPGHFREAGAAGFPGAGALFSGLGPLGALPTAPGLARAFTTLVLAGWGLAGMADTSQLIVSEFATNVVCAAAAPDGSPAWDAAGKLPVLWLRLAAGPGRLRIEVWDTLPAAAGVPAARRAGPEAESGRGLELVSALSLGWGWHPVPGMRDKSVWALLAIP